MLDVLASTVSILSLLFLWFFFFLFFFFVWLYFWLVFWLVIWILSTFSLFPFFILLYEKLREEVFRWNGSCGWFLKPGGAILLTDGEDRRLSMSKLFQCSSQSWAPIRAAGLVRSLLLVYKIMQLLCNFANKDQTGYKVKKKKLLIVKSTSI